MKHVYRKTEKGFEIYCERARGQYSTEPLVIVPSELIDPAIARKLTIAIVELCDNFRG